ncbi:MULTISPECIES: DUF1150 family protein [Paracoccus]|uniref:DUF1150 family protein n=1 Tax=Paracoccus hibiscisoli TaxID=2023261 RepID=A0A4U0QY06_9RHOB|nr:MULTISPECIES: DUF1150 family protein [Paracoccus]ODT60273.1 MAG: hypothetical protein ABS73_06495 [Paracoccus sp. SCN 68-21]TJZ87185.1 DUF1150 family protein [Paracoccus hibiscisoli]
MDSKFDFGAQDRARTVYIRPVALDSLPRDVREQMPDVQTLYAVHDTDGERLALVQDRNLAFTLARQNELRPVSVH